MGYNELGQGGVEWLACGASTGAARGTTDDGKVKFGEKDSLHGHYRGPVCRGVGFRAARCRVDGNKLMFV